LTAAAGWRFFHLAVLRPLLTVTVLLCLYYLLPVDQGLHAWTVAAFACGLAVVVLLVVGEVRMILRSPFPALQGIQALALIVPLFLLLFADVYYILGQDRPGSFDTGLSRTDALYFTVTMFTTVGFGDIVPVSAAARILVTIQMVANLMVLSVALRLIVTAVRHRRSSTSDGSPRLRERFRDQQGGDQPHHRDQRQRGERQREGRPAGACHPGQHGTGQRRPHRRPEVGHTARDPRDVALGRVRAARLDQVHRRGQHDADARAQQEQPRHGARHPRIRPHQQQHEHQPGDGDHETAADQAPL